MALKELEGIYVYFNNVEIVRSLLKDEASRCKVYDAMFDFVRYGKVSLVADENVKAVFRMLLPLLKSKRRKDLRARDRVGEVSEKKNKKCLHNDKKSSSSGCENIEENNAETLLISEVSGSSVEQEQEQETKNKNNKEREINKERESGVFDGSSEAGFQDGVLADDGSDSGEGFEGGYQGGLQDNLRRESLSGSKEDSREDSRSENLDGSIKDLQGNLRRESKAEFLDDFRYQSLSEFQDGFEIPALTQIEKFIAEHNLKVSPKVFFHFYNGKNWMVKDEPLDWREKLLEWEARGAGRKCADVLSNDGQINGGFSASKNSRERKKFANERDFTGVDLNYLFDDLDDVEL